MDEGKHEIPFVLVPFFPASFLENRASARRYHVCFLLAFGVILKYGLDSTITALLNRDVATDSRNIRSLLQSRIENVDSASIVLASDPEIIADLQSDSSNSLIAMDSRAVIVRDRFELDLLQIYDAQNLARTNIVQSSLYQVSSLINIVPPDHSDLYLLGDRLVYLSRRDLNGGVVIVGIDLLSELQRLAYQLSLRDQVSLRQGAISNQPVSYAKDSFSLETLVPVGTKTIVFTVTRDTGAFSAVSQTAQNILMIGLLLIAILLFIVTTFVVRNIVNPIRGLSTAAHEIANADFNKPFMPRDFFDRKHNPFRIGFGDEIGELSDTFVYMEKELHTVYSGLINDLKNANQDLNEAYDATLQGWSSALELRDHETEKHTTRVAKLVQSFARYLDLPESQIANLRRGAYLHDVGKMAIPDHVLNKPGRLSDEEWAIMRQHPLYGYIMLRPIEYLKDALDIPLCHHEHWDGSGYPNGLQNTAIPLAARIFSIVDVWDALTSDRPYRKAWSQEKALDYIRSAAGKEFDPEIVQKFFEWLGTKGIQGPNQAPEVAGELVNE